jgi:hypothetical protein
MVNGQVLTGSLASRGLASKELLQQRRRPRQLPREGGSCLFQAQSGKLPDCLSGSNAPTPRVATTPIGGSTEIEVQWRRQIQGPPAPCNHRRRRSGHLPPGLAITASPALIIVALERWIEIANGDIGEPLFRSIKKGGQSATGSPTAVCVSRSRRASRPISGLWDGRVRAPRPKQRSTAGIAAALYTAASYPLVR